MATTVCTINSKVLFTHHWVSPENHHAHLISNPNYYNCSIPQPSTLHLIHTSCFLTPSQKTTITLTQFLNWTSFKKVLLELNFFPYYKSVHLFFSSLWLSLNFLQVSNFFSLTRLNSTFSGHSFISHNWYDIGGKTRSSNRSMFKRSFTFVLSRVSTGVAARTRRWWQGF